MKTQFLYFGGEHCPQCKVAKPKFIEKAKTLSLDYKIIDVEDDEDNLSSIYAVRSIPHIVVTNDYGGVIDRGNALDMLPKLNQYQ